MAEVKCPAEAASKIAAEKVTVTPIDGGIRVEAEGVAVHGSTPEFGENAIGRLAMALAQLPFTARPESASRSSLNVSAWKRTASRSVWRCATAFPEI